MEKSDLQSVVEAKPAEVSVMPRTLIIRPMEYKGPNGDPIYFSGVFGNDADSKEAGDTWAATFYDRQEAEAYIMASKTFGQPVLGVRLALAKPGEADGARVSDSAQAPVGG